MIHQRDHTGEVFVALFMKIRLHQQVVMDQGSSALRVASEADLFKSLCKRRVMTIILPSSAMKNLLEKSTSHYQNELNMSEHALTYLKHRGLTSETILSFRLGLVENPLQESGHDFMTGRIAIPYMTQTGIVQIRFRSIPFSGIPGDPEPSPKMKGEAGVSTTMYNAVQLLNDSEVICVCEGEFDTMSAVQSGLPAIGIPGANAWQPVYSRALRYRKVIILADNDDHGEGLKFAKTVQNDVRGSRIKLMPEGMDVNNFLVQRGEDELKEFVL
jgi:DNA primase